MRFRRIVVKNYRSIKKADLSFGNITAIVGESDVGKTNLVRAIRDWNHGSIGGDAVTANASSVSIAVCIGESLAVSLQRNKRTDSHGRGSYGSCYLVENVDTGDTILFEKIGGSVPGGVRDLTGMRPFRLADDRSIDLNIVEQGDPWFMLSRPLWTDLTVSRLISKVCGIDSLMRAIKKGKKEAARASGEAKVKKKDMDRLEALVSDNSYDEIDDIGEILDSCDSIIEEQRQCEAKIERAIEIQRSVAESQAKIDVIDGFLETYSAIDMDALNVHMKRAKRLSDARECLKTISHTRRALEETEGHLMGIGESIDKVKSDMSDLIDSGDIVCPLCGGGAHEECITRLKDHCDA